MVSKLKNLTIEERLIKEVHKSTLVEINVRWAPSDKYHHQLLQQYSNRDSKNVILKIPWPAQMPLVKWKIWLLKICRMNYVLLRNLTDNSDKISLSDYSHHKLVQRYLKTNKTGESLWDKLSFYLRTTNWISRFNKNPLEVWADYKVQFPKLYNIAFKYLTMVTSSVLSERRFSKAAQV